MTHNLEESGVAEILGSLMLIAIIGLGIAIAGVYLLNHSVPEKIPEFRASLANTSTSLTLHHDGGESIPRSSFIILVNGNPTNYVSSNASSQDWSIDETLTFYSYDPSTPLPDVKIVYNGSAGERVLADFSSNIPYVVPTHTAEPTYPPTFTSITPNSGPTTGSTAVTIVGTNFVSGGSFGVTIGGASATGVTWNSPTHITAITPAGTAGAKNVVITNNDGQTATGLGAYTYTSVIPPPTFTSITPASGPTAGGQSVTITGANFVTGSTSVTVGGIAATNVSVSSSTLLTATTPAHTAGTVDLIITTAWGGVTGTGVYTYVAVPTFTSITPITGPTAGGQSVTITGTNFMTGATSVTIGGTAATSVSVSSSSILTAITPAHAAGTVNVVVTTPGGSATGIGAYTYYTVLSFTSVGTTSWTPPTGVTSVEYLVVAGGGGGGRYGGGGGAGGFRTGTLTVSFGVPLTVTIGDGGAGSTSLTNRGGNGGNSVFASITSIGGGGGGSGTVSPNRNGASGGSGGGGSTSNGAGGSGTTGQGNAGGLGARTSNYLGGGGGAAGTAGGAATNSVAGSGGTGTTSSISDSLLTYAGGGGGGCHSSRTAGGGGTGGGGAGGDGVAGTAGSNNTGGGGGGSGNSGNGGKGGSGIIIIKYY